MSELLDGSRPVGDVLRELRAFPWDSTPLVKLESAHIRSMLQRYLHAQVSVSQVEDWANAIEGRDDVEFRHLAPILDRLANPDLSGPLTPAAATAILFELGGLSVKK